MKLLRITHRDDDGILLLTTAEDIAKARADGVTRLRLRDADGNFIVWFVQKLVQSGVAMRYEVKYGTGLLHMKYLRLGTIEPWDGCYAPVPKQTIRKSRRRDQPAREIIGSDDTNAACNSFFSRKGDIRIVFGQIVGA